MNDKRRDLPARLKPVVLSLGAMIVTAVAIHKYVLLRPHVDSLLERARALQALAAGDMQNLATAQGLAWVREQLGGTREDLEAIRAEAGPFLSVAEHLGWVPQIGHDLAAAPALVNAGIHLCDAGWWGLLGLEPLVDALSRPDTAVNGAALESALPVLAACRPRFVEAEEALRQAQSARSALAGQELSPHLARWVARLDRYLPVLEAASRLAQVAPQMLGQERPITYLILMQNSHELRATGGFISGAGIVQLSMGKVITTAFQDSYAVDAACDLWAHPPPPVPLRRYMWAPALMFRDANWSPDFPSSALVARSIYRLCRGKNVDAVIGIDLSAVSEVLQALGPLQPAGYPTPVTAESLLEFIAGYWANPLRSDDVNKESGDWWTHRKDFMGDVFQAALQKVTSAPQSIDQRKLAWVVLESLRRKHLIVHFFDSAARQAFADTGWNGALQSAEGDYLMIVDSNVGFRKVNPRIQQSAGYRLDLREGEAPRATLTLHYRNESQASPECIAGARYDDSYQQMMEGCYWDYIRVYVPRTSQLLQVVGSDSEPEASEEAGRTVFSAYFVLAPGASRQLTFEYELPSTVITQSTLPAYHLLVQKQPGSADFPVQVNISGGDWRLDALRSNVTSSGGQEWVAFKLESDARLTWVQTASGSGAGAQPWVAPGIGGGIMLLAGLAVWRYASSREANDTDESQMPLHD